MFGLLPRLGQQQINHAAVASSAILLLVRFQVGVVGGVRHFGYRTFELSQVFRARATIRFHLFRQLVVYGHGCVTIRLDERRERVVVGERVAAVACQRVTCVLAGEVPDEVRFVFAHEAALVGHLVPHGGGDGEERPSVLMFDSTVKGKYMPAMSA